MAGRRAGAGSRAVQEGESEKRGEEQQYQSHWITTDPARKGSLYRSARELK